MSDMSVNEYTCNLNLGYVSMLITFSQTYIFRLNSSLTMRHFGFYSRHKLMILQVFVVKITYFYENIFMEFSLEDILRLICTRRHFCLIILIV